MGNPSCCLFGVCAEASVWVGVALWLIYLALFLGVRAWGVAGMLRELTRAELESTRRRIRLQWEEPAQTTPSEQVLLDQVDGLLSEAERKVSWTLGDRLRALGWNGGAELAAWGLLHDAERLAVAGMAVPYLKARLERAQGDLGELPEERQKIWKRILKKALEDLSGPNSRIQTVAAPTPHEPSFTISALSVPATGSVSLIVGTPDTPSADVATQSAGLCRYLLYLPMVVKTP